MARRHDCPWFCTGDHRLYGQAVHQSAARHLPVADGAGELTFLLRQHEDDPAGPLIVVGTEVDGGECQEIEMPAHEASQCCGQLTALTALIAHKANLAG